MDKEQIIIDGVDVTECDHFSMELPFFNDPCTLYPHGTRCSENKNCYYKQLARKTQECEYLEEEKRDKINLLAQIIEILYSEADEDELYRVAFNCEFIDKAKQLKNDYDRYRKTLEEIEKIIKEGDCVDCREHYYNQHCEVCDKGEILDLISKAKENK